MSLPQQCPFLLLSVIIISLIIWHFQLNKRKMKTRQKKNGWPTVQTTVRGISDESPSTLLSSTERSWKRWKAIYSNKSLLMELKGNPNSQGILNWIIKILHYYYRKQHKNIENSQIIGQNLVISLCPSLCLKEPVLPSPSSSRVFFSSLNVTSHDSWNI